MRWDVVVRGSCVTSSTWTTLFVLISVSVISHIANAQARVASSDDCHSCSHQLSLTPDLSLAFGRLSKPSVRSTPSHPSVTAVSSASRDSLQLAKTSRNRLLRQDVEPSVIALTPTTIVLTLDEHQADTSLSFALIPGKGFNLSSYTPSLRSTNDTVLRSADISLAPPLISSIVNFRDSDDSVATSVANYTAVLEFDRSVGSTEIVVDILFDDPSLSFSSASNHTASKSSVKVFTLTFQFIVCGLSFYYPSANGTSVLLSGGLLKLSSFHALLKKSTIDIQVVVQLPPKITSSVVEFSTVSVTVQGDHLLSDGASSRCLHGNARLSSNSSSSILPTDCSFGFTPFSPPAPLFFAVRLEKRRTGSITFLFVWPGFTKGDSSSLLSELFETTLTIVVPGEADVSVINVFPEGPFRQAGGDLLSCVVVNARPEDVFTLQLDSSIIKPTAVRNSSVAGLVLTFVTPMGEGANVPWDLIVHRGSNKPPYSCPWTGSGPRFVFNYNTRDVQMVSIVPPFGPEVGGILITCTGFFADFNTSRDAILLGSYSLSKDRVVSVNTTAIVFELPPLTKVNPPRRDVDCAVVVAGVRSNAVKFSYESLSKVAVVIAGGSSVSSSLFQIPVCPKFASPRGNASAVVAIAKLNSGADTQRLSFQWTVVHTVTKRQILTVSGGAELQMLSIPIESLTINVAHEVSVVVRDVLFETRVSSKVRLQAIFETAFGISLVPSHDERSIQVPAIDARLTATIVPHGDCFLDAGAPSMSFEWSFAGDTTVLSYTSVSVDTSRASPRRLGREFIIPRDRLTYGRHRVDVTALVSDMDGGRSSAFAWMDIVPAPLRAVIGSGESRISVSAMSDFKISGGGSYDPDEPARNADGLSFSWECEFSAQGENSFARVADCPVEVFPSGVEFQRSFTLSASTLRSLRTFGDSVFVRYSLVVTKDFTEKGVSRTRSSARVSQIVEIVRSEATLKERAVVFITTVDGNRVDPFNAPYYEDIIIAPKGSSDISWRFSLQRPTKESSSFLTDTDNFLQIPGMYDTQGIIASTGALGIRAGTMKPDTEYVFRLEYGSKNAKATSMAEVSIHTMIQPSVSLVSVSPTSGSTDTVFTAVASSSPYDRNFKFWFYVRASGGSEMCVDGCSGAKQVQFRLPVGGQYQLRVALVDARGKLVLAHEEKNVSLTVRQSETGTTDIERVSARLAEALSAEAAGDHAAFILACLSMAEAARATTEKSAAAWEVMASAVNDAILRLSVLYNKTQPSTECSRDYMTVAAAFAGLQIGNLSVLDTEGMLSLCAMAAYAVRNTPTVERLDVLVNLNTTLNAIANAGRVIAAGGSTRGRLVADANGVNSVLLQVSEIAVPTWVEARKRGSACGSEWDENVGGLVRVRGGTFCAAEQGQKVTGEHSALTWCKELFGENGMEHRISAVLGEFFEDYIANSGILKLRRQTTNTATKGGTSRNNEDIPVDTNGMSSHSKAIVRAMVLGGTDDVLDDGKCISIRQEAPPTMEVFDDWDGIVLCPRIVGVSYIERKQLNETVEEDSYREKTLSNIAIAESAATATDGTGEREVMSVLEQKDGVYGVKYGGCIHRKAAVIGVIAGAWLLWVALTLIMAAMVSGTVSGVRWTTRTTAIEVLPPDENFIDRDTYGREAYGQEVFVSDANLGESLNDSEYDYDGHGVTNEDARRPPIHISSDATDVLLAESVDISEDDSAGGIARHRATSIL